MNVALSALQIVVVVVLAVVTAFARFFRWQYLLRSFGARLSTRQSLTAFLVSQVGWGTPLGVGEAAIRSYLGARVWRTSGGPPGGAFRLLGLWLGERVLDVAGLTWLLLVASGQWAESSGVLLAAAAVVAVWSVLAGRTPRPGTDRGRMPHGPAAMVGLCVTSLLVWLPAVAILMVGPILLSDGGECLAGVRESIQVLRGGVVGLIPASLFVSHASSEFLSPGLLVSTITWGMTWIVLSAAGLGVVFRQWRGAQPTGALHFDAIAEEYLDQFSDHMWDLLLQRRVGHLARAIEATRTARSTGLDLGCGIGRQLTAMREKGFRVIGLDPARQLLGGMPRRGDAVVGDARCLPIGDRRLDFIYSVGVIHHLGGREAQETALQEARRALLPGGRLIVQESNPRNPLFRFYMGYVFPLTREIDEGTEWWIWPEAWTHIPGFAVVGIQYFTFLPDFLPQWMLQSFLAVERWLEQSPLRSWSVHYQVVLERLPDAIEA